MPKIKPFEEHLNLYEDWFVTNKFAYKSELQAIRELLPENGTGTGIEIGIGSGLFAAPLGIQKGIDPSPEMRKMAANRNLDVIAGSGESIPLDDNTFKFALMVTTVCFLDNVGKSFQEVNRILTPGGFFINAFVDKDSPVGRIYQRDKDRNIFYRDATFYSTREIVLTMQEAGFINFSFRQTIFHLPEDISEREPVKEGLGEGSFIVVRGQKNIKNLI